MCSAGANLSATACLLLFFPCQPCAQFTFTHIGGGATGSIVTNAEPASYTMVGGGNDIWDVSDDFDFAHIQASGDFDVALRVESLEPVARWSKAGIMAREQLTPDSRMAWTRVTPGDVPTGSGGNGANDTRFSYRSGKPNGAGLNDGQHEEGIGPPEFPNAWLRLQREGNLVRGYASTDGVTWRQQGTQDTATWLTPLSNTIYLGIAVSRHSGPDPVATAEIRNVQPPQIGAHPESVSVPEGSSASFNIGLAGWADWHVQWMEDATDMPGATGRVYMTPTLSLAQSGKRYSARALDLISGQVFTSTEAELTVIPDTFAPTLVSAATPISPTPLGTEFSLIFSEPVRAADAENLVNYSISAGATLYTATLQADGKTVRFTTSDLYGPGCKTVTVNNVRDRVGNAIVPSTLGIMTAKGSIRYHQYNGIGGTAVLNLTQAAKFPDSPDRIEYVTMFENPEASGDNFNDYGGQFAGFVHAPITGEYRFYIASDDQSELYLSTDENPANKVLIAREPQWAGFREYVGLPTRRGCVGGLCENVSPPIQLRSGCRYYMECLWKEGGGGDYASVTWQPPGSPRPMNGSLPILGQFLSPYDVPPSIPADQPADIVTLEGRRATFFAEITGSPRLDVQWYRDGVAIPGANDRSYSIQPLGCRSPDNGGTFYVIAQNSFGAVTSRTATLTVRYDASPPQVLFVTASTTFRHVTVRFDEPLDPLSLEDAFNYAIYDAAGVDLPVDLAELRSDGLTVDLWLNQRTPLAPDQTYTVLINNISDLCGNAIAPDTTLSFQSFTRGCGGTLFEAYREGNVVPFYSARISGADSRLAFPDDSHEGYLSKMRGLFVPPSSGNWVLYLRSDDQSRLWFNPNGPDPAGKQLVAEEMGCCQAFEAIPTQRFALIAGKAYYLEASHQERSGGDYCQIAARLEGSNEPLQPITARDLGSFAQPNAVGPVIILQQPADLTVLENRIATFEVVATNSFAPFLCYQWLRDGLEIPGATESKYSFRPRLCIDNGAVFSVRVSTAGYTGQSAEATLTVTGDLSPPQIATVSGSETLDEVRVEFSEIVDASSAKDAFNYYLRDLTGNPLAITDLALHNDGRSVTLATALQTPGAAYTLSVTGVLDLSCVPNPVHDERRFNAFAFSPGFILFEAFETPNADSLLENPFVRQHISGFDSRLAFSDNSHERYAGRLRGLFVPQVSGDYIFYLRSDDSSRLLFNPNGPERAGAMVLSEESLCCNAFSAHTSAPQSLIAGRAYYLEALYKEGIAADYCQVAVKLTTDPTPPDSLQPIPSNVLGSFMDRAGLVCQSRIFPEQCLLTFPNDATTYLLNADVILEAAVEGPDRQFPITWVINETNVFSGPVLPMAFGLGCHSVALLAHDGRTGCSDAFEICVISANEAVDLCIAQVERSNLSRRIQRPLVATLKATAASFDRGTFAAGAGQLGGYINKVRAQLSRGNPEEAEAFIGTATQIIQALRCINPPAE